MNVDYLRQAFHEDAQLAGPPPADPYESVLARRQRSDRRRMASLAAGLAVVMVAVAVPLGLSLVGKRDAQVAAPPPTPAADVFSGPTRGSLAGDADFLTALTQLSWIHPSQFPVEDPMFPNPPVETRHVAFAGDVDSGRWAFIVGPNTTQPTGDAADPDLQTDLGALSDLAGAWFVGPAGATPEQMTLVTIPRGFSPDMPASLYNGLTGALVVLGAPEDFIEVSARPEVAADATVSRSYTDTETTEGLAVLTVAPNAYAASAGMPAVQYRVTRGGAVVAEQVPDSYNDPSGVEVSPDLVLEYLRAPEVPPGLEQEQDQHLAAEIVSEYGLTPDQLNLRVHYFGPAPGTGIVAAVTVVTATFPSGAVLTRATWMESFSDGESGGVGCVDQLSPAGAPAAERIIAMRCERPQMGEQVPDDPTSLLVVLIPPGIGASSAVADGSSATTAIPLADPGFAIVAFPDGAEKVQILAEDGTVLDEVPIMTA